MHTSSAQPGSWTAVLQNQALMPQTRRERCGFCRGGPDSKANSYGEDQPHQKTYTPGKLWLKPLGRHPFGVWWCKCCDGRKTIVAPGVLMRISWNRPSNRQ